MTTTTELVDSYIDMWNETDAGRRRALIARIWTQDARYADPTLKSEGRAGIDAMVQGVQERFPGFRFRRAGAIDEHNGSLRFVWELGPEGGAAVVKGIDIGVLSPERQLQSITGFFDQVPQAA
jgi:hypothetical protein